MNPTYNATHERINRATNESALLANEQAKRFRAPAQSRLMEGYSYNTIEEGYECTASEGKPMSTSELTVVDESMSSGKDASLPYGMTYAPQTPQMYIQQARAPAYQPIMYDPRYHTQQSYNFQPVQMVVHSPGYANTLPRQVQVGSPQMSLSQPQRLQHQNVVHHTNQQQSPAPPQYWASMPVSTTAVPRMVNHASYSGIQQTNTDTRRVSPNVLSSTVGTPVMSYYSPGGYVYMNTPVSSVPCTPNLNTRMFSSVPCTPNLNTPMFSSVPCTPNQYYMASSDMPPVLQLNNQSLTVPKQISCSINPAPVPSELQRTNSSPVPVPTACSHSSANLQTTPTNTVSVDTSANNSEQSAAVEMEEDEDVWSGTCNYTEYQENGGSNLFVTWSVSKSELIKKLRQYKLEVRDVLRTSDENVCNVIFESHPTARKAFTMQREIRLRMVPPKNSQRNWLRNPSPKFLVKFETRRRLPVKKGKAECHDLVGELLMSNCEEQKGCVIWADQLKGHRIRVVSCDGKFMFPGGRVMQMKGVSTEDDGNTSLGWISYRCKHTRESFVIRRSGNLLGDYIYRG